MYRKKDKTTRGTLHKTKCLRSLVSDNRLFLFLSSWLNRIKYISIYYKGTPRLIIIHCVLSGNYLFWRLIDIGVSVYDTELAIQIKQNKMYMEINGISKSSGKYIGMTEQIHDIRVIMINLLNMCAMTCWYHIVNICCFYWGHYKYMLKMICLDSMIVRWFV
jgi:hypothetical protein